MILQTRQMSNKMVNEIECKHMMGQRILNFTYMWIGFELAVGLLIEKIF